jgi:hypothetical protein
MNGIYMHRSRRVMRRLKPGLRSWCCYTNTAKEGRILPLTRVDLQCMQGRARDSRCRKQLLDAPMHSRPCPLRRSAACLVLSVLAPLPASIRCAHSKPRSRHPSKPFRRGCLAASTASLSYPPDRPPKSKPSSTSCLHHRSSCRAGQSGTSQL